MNRENRNIIIAVGIVLVIIAGAYGLIRVSTGMDEPFSVIMSSSMQHDPNESQIGCIDTGDLMIVGSPDSTRTESYVLGTQTGYMTFGDYGSVVVYDRGSSANPVIHRAILWLEWDDERSVWTSPELKDYEGVWYTSDKSTWDNLTGTLYFKDITQSKKFVSINLSSLNHESGYLTMGDNPRTNNTFDQGAISGVKGLVGGNNVNSIKSIAVAEIPWIGTIKILTLYSGKNLEYVPNSIPSMLMIVVILFSAIAVFDLKYVYILNRKLTDLNR